MTINGLFIRRAVPDDALILSGLILENAGQILRPHYNDEQWDVFAAYYAVPAMLRKFGKQVIFCAQRDGRVVGTIALQDNMVVGFYTRFGYTGEGIGTSLLSHAEKFAAASGTSRLRLFSSPEGVSFYLKNGWAEIKNTIMHYSGVGFEETLMEKQL